MNDPRVRRLAEILIDHSCQLTSGQKVLIETYDLPEPSIVCRLVELAAAPAIPLVSTKQNAVLRSLYLHGTDESLGLVGRWERARMEQMDAYIGIHGAANSSQFADVPLPQMDRYTKHWWQPVHSQVRITRTKWVVLRWPTDSFAQSAEMSSDAFCDFYFDVCTADYAQMAKDQEPLVARMTAAKTVRITGPGTELEFSIAGIPVRPALDSEIFPDGEVFTAPVRDSVNGRILFNTQSRYQGTVFDGVEFEFKAGRIVAARANETEKINQILDSDEGARYIGEWSLGCNNRVRRPMLDTLFDEKIGGSMHLTPGNAYDEADNGNRSRIHWDLVLIQTPEYGGGEVHFDGELVRKDGRFVPADLQPLNAGL